MKKRLVSLVLLAALLAGVWWLAADRGPQVALGPPAADPAVLAALERPASLAVIDVLLDEVLELLSKEHGIEVQLAPEAQPLGKTPINFGMEGVRLKSLLSRLAADVDTDLGPIVEGDRVLIANVEDRLNDPRRFIGRTFAIPPELQGLVGIDSDVLADTIISAIDPVYWEDVGGVGVVTVLPDAVVVTAAPEIVEQVAELVDDVLSMNLAERQPTARWCGLDEARMQQWAEALRRPSTVVADDRPLVWVMQDLAQQHDVPIHLPIHLDRLALQAVGLEPFQHVTVDVEQVSLASALNLALEQLDLAFVIYDDVLLVTTVEESENDQQVRLYGVRDLLGGADQIDVDTLIELMTTIMMPYSWVEVGGPSSVCPCGDVLVVAQTMPGHEQIERLLDELRARSDPVSRPRPIPPSASVQRIERALAEPVTLAVDETSLAELALWIRAECDINVVIDERALDRVGLAVVDPVELNAKDLPLELALRQAIEPLDLELVVDDEVLMITTVEEAEYRLEMRFYDVRHLVDIGTPILRRPTGGWLDFDSLTDVVQTACEPETWDCVGGPASLECIGGTMVVSQMRAVHRQVAALLAALEYAQDHPDDQSPIAASPPESPQLDTVVDLHLDSATVSAATEQLAQNYGILMRSDPDLVSVASLSPDMVGPMHLTGIPLHTAARLLASHPELSYGTRNGELWIGYRDDLRVTRVYPVGDLVGSAPIPTPSGPISLNRQMLLASYPLVDMLRAMIDPASWAEVGGPANVVAFEMPNQQVLVVSQTFEAHRQIEALLQRMREIREANDTISSPLLLSDAHQRVADALQVNTSLSCRAEPLAELVRRLAVEHDLNIVVDWWAIRHDLIDPRAPVTCDVADTKLESALAAALESVDARLTISVQEHVVLITSHNHYESMRQLRLYDVGDLESSFRVPEAAAEFGLKDLVRRMFGYSSEVGWVDGADSWHDTGLLVVGASPDQHRSLEQLLAYLRDEANPLPSPAEVADELDSEAIARITEHLQPDKPASALIYALYLLTVAAELPAELTPTLLQLLTDLPPTERPEGYGLLWRVVGRCGPEAAGAVDVFETHWPAMTFGQRAAAMRAVAKLGPRGVDRLCTMLEDDRHGMREQACRALAEAGSDAHRAIPVLLKLLGDEDNTQRPLTDTVKRIDPSGAHSRKVVKDWLESDHAEDRRRGRDVNEIVEELFRPPPQRWTGGGMF